MEFIPTYLYPIHGTRMSDENSTTRSPADDTRIVGATTMLYGSPVTLVMYVALMPTPSRMS